MRYLLLWMVTSHIYQRTAICDKETIMAVLLNAYLGESLTSGDNWGMGTWTYWKAYALGRACLIVLLFSLSSAGNAEYFMHYVG